MNAHSIRVVSFSVHVHVYKISRHVIGKGNKISVLWKGITGFWETSQPFIYNIVGLPLTCLLRCLCPFHFSSDSIPLCVCLCMWKYWHICDGPAFSFQRCKYCLFLAIYFGRDMKTIPMVSDNLRMLCTFKLKLKVSKYGPVRQFRHTHTILFKDAEKGFIHFPHSYIYKIFGLAHRPINSFSIEL